jgi:hypothetical protein
MGVLRRISQTSKREKKGVDLPLSGPVTVPAVPAEVLTKDMIQKKEKEKKRKRKG